jgi:predicted metal-dependent hydrolase
MTAHIELGDIAVEVVKKDIKNLHLSVYPPHGAVRISAPLRMKLDTIRVFAISKLDWIKQQQTKLRAQERETPREYLDRESHYVWGKRYLLKVVEADAPPSLELKHSRIVLRVRPGTTEVMREAMVAQWYREQIRATVPALIAKWERGLGVKVARVFVQKMKTKWGGCNPEARSIRLNTALAKKPAQCLEYIVVHELVHLLERNHNDHFTSLMDRHMPDWKHRRDVLNRAPLGDEHWSY